MKVTNNVRSLNYVPCITESQKKYSKIFGKSLALIVKSIIGFHTFSKGETTDCPKSKSDLVAVIVTHKNGTRGAIPRKSVRHFANLSITNQSNPQQ